MKVKDLIEIFNCTEEKLLELLSNVGVDISLQGDTFVEKEVEKKLARYFNVPYPFKSGKKEASPKPRTVVPIKKAAPKKAVKPQPQTKQPQSAQPKRKHQQSQSKHLQAKQPTTATTTKQASSTKPQS